MDYEMDEDLNSDERDGCRSLLCDANGIIIAEMVYRCMACSRIHDFMGEARRHYHENHMEDEDDFVSSSVMHNNSNSIHCNEANNNSISYGNGPGLGWNGHQSGEDKQLALYETGRNSFESFPSELRSPYPCSSYKSSICKSNTVSNRKLVDSSWKKNSGGKSKTAGAANAPTESCTRSGYITCPVCTSTRFYTTLQRRYGQFTCVACYRFFKEFFTKPRKYYCPNLGLCSLDVKAKCKACWISACVSVYSIDGKRKAIIEANSPSNLPVLETPPPNLPLAIEHSESSKLGDEQSDDIPLTIVAGDGNQNNKTPSTFESYKEDIQKDKDKDEAKKESAAMEEDEVEEVEDEDNCQESNEEFLEEATSSTAANATVTETSNCTITICGTNTSGTIPNGTPDSPKPDLRKRAKARVKNWCCLQCKNCLADDCGKCINCLDRPKFGGKFIRKQRCINKKCLLKMPK